MGGQKGNKKKSRPNNTTTSSKSPLSIAKDYKEQGNRQSTKGEYEKALESYTKAIESIHQTNNGNTNDNHHQLNNNGNGKKERQSEERQLFIKLYSNCAHCCLQLHQYEKVVEHCTVVLDDENYHDGNNSSDIGIAKLYYRRGVAQEKLALQYSQAKQTAVTDTTDQPASLISTYYENAHRDLSRAYDLSKSDPKTRRSVTVDVLRVKKALADYNAKTKDALTEASKNRPLPIEQAAEVLELLESRYRSLSSSHRIHDQEACVLVDYGWWCDWYFHVNLLRVFQQKYEVRANNNDGKDLLLSFLLPFTELPDAENDKQIDDDDNAGSDSYPPPGPLDASELSLLPSSIEDTAAVYNLAWYNTYHPHMPATTSFVKEKVCSVEGVDTKDFMPLKPYIVRGYDYEVVPREVYAALKSWYGEKSSIIYRRTVAYTATGPYENDRIQLKLYPQWHIRLSNRRSDRVCGACRAPGAKSRCTRCYASLYCNRTCQVSHWPFHKRSCSDHNKTKNTDDDNNKNETNTDLQPLTDGLVGLRNLGNTCFLNSAIQALRHAAPLTRYFLSHRFQFDVNKTNKLGTGGRLAEAYDVVLRELWMSSLSSTTPSSIKNAVTILAPRFGGFAQHDAQEFLAYLLDGLHEDLNRVKVKPYFEAPDVGENENMIVAGARAWESFQRRDDSLVVDTFYGQYKSTCVCPSCSRVSVSFDSFNHVSLQIPQLQHSLPMPEQQIVYLFPDERSLLQSSPMRYDLDVSSCRDVSDVIQELARLSNRQHDRLRLFSVENHKIRDNLPLNTLISVIPSEVYAYDLDPVAVDNVRIFAYHCKTVGKMHQDEDLDMGELIGIPIVFSVPMNATCRQVWERIWSLVSHYVSGSTSNSSSESNKHLLQVRVPVKSIEAVTHVNEVEEKRSEDDVDMTDSAPVTSSSFLPSDSDTPLSSFVSVSGDEDFYEFCLEWNLGSTDNVNEDAMEEDNMDSPVDEAVFKRIEEHDSVAGYRQKVEAIRNARRSPVSLSTCFDAFVTPERLDEDNPWYCPECKDRVRALKTMELWRIPNVLIIHLKRFEFRHMFRRERLDTLVDFPLDGLDLSMYCGQHSKNPDEFIANTVPADYDLFAVINHYGNMGGGHYTAYARQWDEDYMSSDWFLYNDSNVSKVSGVDGHNDRSRGGIISDAAYVLFYRRRVFH